MLNIQLLLLAAGASKRMGEPKQLLSWGTKRIIEHQLEILLATNKSVSVVLGAYSKEITLTIEKFPISIFINEHWENGMGSSISFGVQQLLAKDPTIDGILISLIDQPLITTHHFEKILSLFQPTKKQIIVSNSKNGWSGAPVLFDKIYFNELIKLKGDEGAKVVTSQYKDFVKLIDAGNKLIDMDTPDAYLDLLNKLKGSD